MTEQVNSPSHYVGKSGIEARDITHAYRLGPDLTQAFDYVVRAGRKTVDPRKDLEKAINYLRFAAQHGRDLSFGIPIPHVRPSAPEAVAEDFDLCLHRTMAVEHILAAYPGISDCLTAAEALERAIETYTRSLLPVAHAGHAA